MGVILSSDAIAFSYAGRPEPVFSEVSLDIADGEIVCVLGPNGIGKSTLLRCLSGLAPVTAGGIRIAGRDMAAMSRNEIARHLALVPQSDEAVFAFPVHAVAEMGRAPYLGLFERPGRQDARLALEALATLGIAHLAEASYTEISGGERQLVQIARVLVQSPKLMILDEPTAHLDFANTARLLALLRRLAKSGLAVIFTTHVPDHAYALADRTLILSPHHLPRMGDTRDLLTAEVLSATYGVPIRLVASQGHMLCIAEADQGCGGEGSTGTPCSLSR